MSGRLVLDISLPLDRFTLAVQWDTSCKALGIFGPSGAGKTSILEAIAGLRRETTGRIAVHGRTWLDTARGIALPPERRGVGYVPQDGRLFPHLDVMGNVLAGRRRASLNPERRLNPRRVLDVLELGDCLATAVTALSGGERQRVALARALCSGADLLLLDEPLSMLELPLRRRILPYLIRVQREFGIPTLHVSHDATEIRLLCEEAIILKTGSVPARGRPEDLFTGGEALSLAWAEGFENVLRGRVMEIPGPTAQVEIEPGVRLIVPGRRLTPGHEVAVSIRADDLILAVEPPAGLSAQNIVAGSITSIRAAGDRSGEGEAAAGIEDAPVLVTVVMGGGRVPLVVALTERARDQLRLAIGQPVHLVFKVQSCHTLEIG